MKIYSCQLFIRSPLSYIMYFFFLLSFSAEAQSFETKYIVSTSGNRTDISRFVELKGDSVVFSEPGKGSLSLIPIDSLAEYHHNKQGKTGRGILVGGGIGMITGAIIGAAVVANSSSNSLENMYAPVGGAFLGGIAGGLAGGLIGAAIGGSSSIHENIDLRGRPSAAKKNIIFHMIDSRTP
jgi:hypothetical protein